MRLTLIEHKPAGDMRMVPPLAILIEECMNLQYEIGLLTPVILSLSPISTAQPPPTKISKAGRDKFREKLEKLMGVEKVKADYFRCVRELDTKLSDLAERLEELGFEVEKLEPQLSETQYHWLLTHSGDLKRYLKGILL